MGKIPDGTNAEILEKASEQIGVYNFDNFISGRYEITRKDLRGLIHKTRADRNLAEIIESVIAGIRDIVENGEYLGWNIPEDGKHPETAFFVYFGKDLGRIVYLGLRYMRTERIFKPYAVYSDDGFKERKDKIEKGRPLYSSHLRKAKAAIL